MSGKKPKVTILYAPGTNCQHETAFAFARAGAQPRIVFLEEVVKGKDRLDDGDIFCLPGGFSYGDHVRAGCLAGLILKTIVKEQVANIVQRPWIAICNGFQIAAEAEFFGSGVTLAHNIGGTFHHQPLQPHIVAPDTDCIWLKGLQGKTLHFPCSHGEGRLLFNNRDGWRPAIYYPEHANPDGTTENITAITTLNGLGLGMMNHPERAWRDEANMAIINNAVRES
ncbi:MAG: phosphoribosylformylglycinamidine synthase subunit PurQ [Alphaproteobacteria bacterium]